MKKFMHLFLRPRLLWLSLAYVSGVKKSRLFTVKPRPNAPYRAIVIGLDEDYWAHFDAAYPEFEKLFAREDVLLSELRLAFTYGDTAAIVFHRTNRRKLAASVDGTNTVVFEGTAAPVPVLAKNGEYAYGFALDSAGKWLAPRRPTEFSIILENFNFEGRQAFLDEASLIVKALKIEPPASEKCLVITHNNDAEEVRQQINSELLEVAKATVADVPHSLFSSSDDEWWKPEVQGAFIELIQNCTTVVTHSSPLGMIALLAGRTVKVTGRPVWAGFGLEGENSSVYRRRSLTMTEFAALLMFVLSRYVDDSGNVVDPLDGWELPMAAKPSKGISLPSG
ncbi:MULTISPECIES: hypothetical protein [unclassified Rhizobium]|uniref:capsular polysaccharide export protein, LipB/KpsS family n=1 Tax=unclassified Rhizobium TaxID=2613769 RepID=UPI001AE77DAB|nr:MULTISPECIES: hypothetical protein [unclassified Rhizobium]MBP2460149.1 hypothetical protein [Rhizobium sp. PvP014]MBP2531508.1 hypothetical protein [Rhizobium sp. PvP099]